MVHLFKQVWYWQMYPIFFKTSDFLKKNSCCIASELNISFCFTSSTFTYSKNVNDLNWTNERSVTKTVAILVPRGFIAGTCQYPWSLSIQRWFTNSLLKQHLSPVMLNVTETNAFQDLRVSENKTNILVFQKGH